MSRTITIDPQIARGEAVTLNFTIYTTDAGSTPENIAGWTLAFTVSKRENSVTKMIGPKSCSLVTPASGTASVDITAAETNLSPGTYFCDLWRTDAGFERMLASGDFPIAPAARVPAS